MLFLVNKLKEVWILLFALLCLDKSGLSTKWLHKYKTNVKDLGQAEKTGPE